MAVRDRFDRLPLAAQISLQRAANRGGRSAYVCFLCSAVRVLFTWLYWPYLFFTSLSILETSYDHEL